MLLAVGLTAGVDAASAGTYTVWSCTSPTGRAAPLNWEVLGPATRTENACGGVPAGRYFLAHAQDSNQGPLDPVERHWGFRAPDGMTLVGGALWWSGSNPDTSASALRVAAIGADAVSGASLTGSVTLLAHGAPFGLTDPSRQLGDDNRELLPPFRKAWSVVTVACHPFAPEGTCDGFMQVYRSAITIEEAAPPAGQLDSPAPAVLRGRVSYPLHATDTGAGVWAARAFIDGKEVGQADLDQRDQCSDQAPGNATPYDFVFKLPCAGAGNTTLAVDTGALPDGDHQLRIEVVDAAGNATPIHDRSVVIDNLTPAGEDGPVPACYFRSADRKWFNPAASAPVGTGRPNDGAPADVNDIRLSMHLPVRRRGERSPARRTRRTIGYWSRPTLRGAAVDRRKAPIRGATVYIATRAEDGEWCLDPSALRLSARGRFSIRLPARRPSRRIAVLLFPSSGSNQAAISRSVKLQVRSGVTVRPLPRTVRSGDTIAFRGRILGRLPRRGAVAAVQLRDRGRWRSVRSFRVPPGQGGRYTVRYQVRRARTTSSRFRVFVPRQSGRPYASGASRPRVISLR